MTSLFASANASGEAWVLARYSSASHAVTLAGPLLAVVAALRTPGLDAYLSGRPSARRGAGCQAFWPLLAGGPAAVTLAVAGAAQRLPHDGRAAAILAVVAAKVLGCVLLGIVVGRVLPPVVGVPAVGIGLYAWLTLPATGSSVVLRQLNGSFVACCTVDQQPSATMLAASGAVLATAVAGCLLALVARTRVAVAGALAATLATSAAAGVVVVETAVRPPNLLAVEARDDEPVCQARRGVRLCVWPEHAPRLSSALGVHLDVVTRLVEVGLDPPRAFSERPDRTHSRTQVAPDASEADLRVSAVAGLLPDPATCRTAGTPEVYSVYDRAFAWLALSAGVDARRLEMTVGAAAVRSVEADVAGRPPLAQGRWYREQAAVLAAACR